MNYFIIKSRIRPYLANLLLRSKNVLPEGYTQLEYIESTGTQYIDTGINADNNKKIVIDTEYISISNENNTNMFAIKIINEFISRIHFMVQEGRFRFFYGKALSTDDIQNLIYDIKKADTSRHQFEFDLLNRKIKVDNDEYKSLNNVSINLDMNFFLFCRNSTKTLYYNSSKLYNCQIYDNNILVRNFIPCKNPNNEVGLYDLVSNTFFGNSGTGEFIPGNNL